MSWWIILNPIVIVVHAETEVADMVEVTDEASRAFHVFLLQAIYIISGLPFIALFIFRILFVPLFRPTI